MKTIYLYRVRELLDTCNFVYNHSESGREYFVHRKLDLIISIPHKLSFTEAEIYDLFKNIPHLPEHPIFF